MPLKIEVKLLCLLFSSSIVSGSGFACDRTPRGGSPKLEENAGRYKIEVSGNPTTYVPGEQYTGWFLRKKAIRINYLLYKSRVDAKRKKGQKQLSHTMAMCLTWIYWTVLTFQLCVVWEL